MTGVRPAALCLLAPVLAALVACCGCFAAPAGAEELSNDGNASWKLEQPAPPPPPAGVEPSNVPIGLGHVGDIEFWGPDRGLLITAGNPRSVPPGVWVYDGVSWRELADVCGATDGRIIWAGPEEFWTISDGRPGQQVVEGKTPNLEDNTLCHFADGHIAASFASIAFRSTSYQAMHGGACLSPANCWFAGAPLPSEFGEPGAFQLHWDGTTLSADPNPQGHAVESVTEFENEETKKNEVVEGVNIRPTFKPAKPEDEDHLSEAEPTEASSDLHTVSESGVLASLVSTSSSPIVSGAEKRVPLYSETQAPWTLEAPHLSSDGKELWAAVDPRPVFEFPPENPLAAPGEVTIVHGFEERWEQVVGPLVNPEENTNPFTKTSLQGLGTVEQRENKEKENEVVDAIAAEPRAGSAWLALGGGNASTAPTRTGVPAMVARLEGDGTVSDRESLPAEQEAAEGVGPKGAASKIVCPAQHDCWMVTSEGWLFHLADQQERAHPVEENMTSFTGLISERPRDEGIPEEPEDSLPEDDSGVGGEAPATPPPLKVEIEKLNPFAMVTLPLLSGLHSRLVHGITLELKFHLAVKARVQLLAERRKRVVAKTATKTLAAGNRSLLLKLDPHRWPTKLNLKTRALAPLPQVSTRSAGTETVTTSAAFPNALGRLISGPLF